MIEKLSIRNVQIVNVQNILGQERDQFTACIDAAATDYKITNTAPPGSDSAAPLPEPAKEFSGFREFWTYEWERNQWLLRQVDQANQWGRIVSTPIVDEG